MMISMRREAVLGALGYMPTIMLAALAERNFDTVAHQRQSVLKHHGLPAKRRAQKMLASNIVRQVRRRDDPRTIDDVTGEAFAVTQRGQRGGANTADWGDFLANLEYGADIEASGMMAIPTVGAVKMFRRQLAAGKLMLGPRASLVRKVGGKNARSEFVGVLRNTRTQRPMLGFYKRWDEVLAAELPEYERDLDRVLTAAGRAKLERTITVHRAAREAFSRTFHDFITRHPARHADARKAAAAVAKEVRRAGKARKG